MINEAKKARIRELRQQGYPYAKVMELERVSPRDISSVEKEMQAEYKQAEKMAAGSPEKLPQEKVFVQVYRLLSQGRTLLDISIWLGIDELTVTRYYQEYCRLKQLDDLISLRNQLGDRFGDFAYLGQMMIDKKIEKKTIEDTVVWGQDIRACQVTLSMLLTFVKQAKAELAQETSKARQIEEKAKAAERNLALSLQQVKQVTLKRNELEDGCHLLAERKVALENRIKVLETSERRVVAHAADRLAAMFLSHYPIVEAVVRANIKALRKDSVDLFALLYPERASWVIAGVSNEQQAQIIAEQRIQTLTTKIFYEIMENEIRQCKPF